MLKEPQNDLTRDLLNMEMERNMLCSVMREADNAKHDFPGLTEPNAWLTKPVRSPSCVHPC